jgi:hypothetical protein
MISGDCDGLMLALSNDASRHRTGLRESAESRPAAIVAAKRVPVERVDRRPQRNSLWIPLIVSGSDKLVFQESADSATPRAPAPSDGIAGGGVADRFRRGKGFPCTVHSGSC